MFSNISFQNILHTLAFFDADTGKDPTEVPMDVCDENILSHETHVAPKGVIKGVIGSSAGATTSSHIPNLMLHGCDSSSTNSAPGATSMSPQATVIGSDISLDQIPCPKHISEQELTILQVREKSLFQYMIKV